MARLWSCAALLLGGCSSVETMSEPPPAQPPPVACAPGESTLEDGSCEPAGVPPGECAPGFVADDARGCTPILPAELCPDGSMAVPGDEACRPVAPCGAIAPEPGAIYVDASYTGGGDDGSAAKPYSRLAEALAVAPAETQLVVAAGTYAEDLPPIGRTLRIWGVCPSQVKIALTSELEIYAAAPGTEVHGVAFEGAGLLLAGARDVLIEQTWIHDTVDRGLEITELGQPASVTVRDSLVESATGLGVFIYGAEVVIERSDVRETVDYPPAYASMGVGAFDSSSTGVRSTLAVHDSVVEANPASGVFVYGSDATIEASVLRNTRVDVAGRLGSGLFVQRDPDTAAPAKGTVIASVIQANHFAGVEVIGGEIEMRATTVRDTQFCTVAPCGGGGLVVEGDAAARATAKVSASLFERNLWIGAYVANGDATLAGVVVRDTKAREDGHLGVGVGADASEGMGRGALTLVDSLVEHNENGGLYIAGSDATIEHTLIRDLLPEPVSQQFGRGIQLQAVAGQLSNGVVRDSLIERSLDVGVFAAGTDLLLERTTIRDTAPRALDGQIGDGLVAYAVGTVTSVTLVDVRIENSARAGILNYDALVTIGGSVLECNLIQLDGESELAPYEFVVTSPNVCGCQGVTEDCKVLSSMLEAPAAP